jgi:Mycothiol maleylpyruvate isomerase N-terminal domain
MTDTDRRADLASNFTHAVTIVAGVSPDQLGDPTPCPDYDVAGLIDHLIGASWLGVAPRAGSSLISSWPTLLISSAAPGRPPRRRGQTTLVWPLR